MPLGVECDDGLVHDRLGAARAARRELVGVATRAVGAAGLGGGVTVIHDKKPKRIMKIMRYAFP